MIEYLLSPVSDQTSLWDE